MSAPVRRFLADLDKHCAEHPDEALLACESYSMLVECIWNGKGIPAAPFLPQAHPAVWAAARSDRKALVAGLRERTDRFSGATA